MKKIGIWCLALSLLVGVSRAECAPPVYRITDGKGHQAYLLGTLHVGFDGLYPWSEAVENAYEAADALAVEADVVAMEQDPAAAARYSAALVWGPGEESRKHLSPETYALGVNALGLGEARLNRLLPMAWYTLAANAQFARLGLATEAGMDRLLLERAHRDGKSIVEMEGAQAQAELMRRVPDRVADALLYQLLAEPEAADRELTAMIRAWQTGNEEDLARLVEAETDQLADLGQAEKDAYERLMYTERNRGFAQKIRDALETEQTVLFAVGGAHIVGTEGIKALLCGAGLNVEKIK